MNRAVLRLQLASPADAAAAVAALEPDNEGHATCRAEGRVVVIEAKSETRLGLLRTLDDLLGCLRATGVG